MLDTSRWELSCGPPLTFQPPPYPECTAGWRGKDVQYPHSLGFSADGRHALAGVEFEDRCPGVARIPLLEFAALVDATLHGR